MDIQTSSAHCAYCHYAQLHNLPLCEQAGRTSQDINPESSSQSRHDNLRDTVARDWQMALQLRQQPVLAIACECGNSVNQLPLEGIKVATEYTYRGKRPDIAILNSDNDPCLFGEIIDQGPPSPSLLELYRKAGIPVLFIPYTESRNLLGYCSVQCWDDRQAVKQHSDINNTDFDTLDADSLRWCEDCGMQLKRNEAIIDCQGVFCPKCIGADIIHLCCWGRDPFNNGCWVDEHSTLAELLALWNSTDFWRFVWEKRVREPSESYGGPKDESLTSSALQYVDTAIINKQFNIAYHQLLDIGRNPLTAFESSNCLTVARCWGELEVHVESILPSDFKVTRRPDDWEK